MCVRVRVCVGGWGVGICKVKVVSAGWKKDINLKVLHSPVIQGAKVHLDLPRSQLCAPSGLCYHCYHTIVTFP